MVEKRRGRGARKLEGERRGDKNEEKVQGWRMRNEGEENERGSEESQGRRSRKKRRKGREGGGTSHIQRCQNIIVSLKKVRVFTSHPR